MTEQDMEEYRQRYYAGMRAMSKEQMEALALSQAEGMRQAEPSGDYMRGQAQGFNMWPQLLADELPKPTPPTRMERLRKWWRECFFKDGADGGM